MTTPNKGGRPTREEALAKSADKSELEGGLRILKRAFGPALNRMVEAATDSKLTPEKQFKMAQDIANMYMAMLRADKALKALARGETEEPDDTDKPPATIFQLHATNG